MPDRDAIFDDLAIAYQKAIKAFYDAGCRYLQFDDTAWAYLCSQEELKKAQRPRPRRRPSAGDLHASASTRRWKPSPPTWRSPPMSAAATSVRPSFPRAVTSRWPRVCSAKCNYDGYFLEYDSDRAGGFEPLRFLPKGNKIVVLGLVTSKSGRLEPRDDVKTAHRRGDEIRRRSISSACHRNAALRRPKKATFWPKTSNGPSCAMIVEIAERGVG